MPEIINNITNPGEIDTYDINFIAGHTYYLQLGGGTTLDPFLTLRLNGDFIASDNDGGVGDASRLVFTPSETASYQVQVSGNASTTGVYTLLAFEDDARDSVEGVGDAPFVETGQERAGALDWVAINSRDVDVFSVALVSGLTYRIEARGQQGGEGTLYDPLMTLRDGAGTALAQNDDYGGGRDSRIDFTPGATGIYYIEADSYDFYTTGSYRLHVYQGVGTAGADVIRGTARGDAMSGAGGTDLILGNRGDDILRGADGADTLNGGAGADVLSGGRGADTFDFNKVSAGPPEAVDILRGADGATAFEGAGAATGDMIDLSDIDANAGASGNQAFILGGAGAGHLSLVDSGGDTFVRGNVDGDGAFEFQLRIEDGAVLASAYTAADFVL